jgi:hypothetical protein
MKPSKQLTEALRLAGLVFTAVEPLRGGTVRVTLANGRTIKTSARPSCDPSSLAQLRKMSAPDMTIEKQR